MKVTEWSQLYTLIFQMLKLQSTLQSVMEPKFKLIQAVMVVLVTCKTEEDPFKNEDARVVTTFLQL